MSPQAGTIPACGLSAQISASPSICPVIQGKTTPPVPATPTSALESGFKMISVTDPRAESVRNTDLYRIPIPWVTPGCVSAGGTVILVPCMPRNIRIETKHTAAITSKTALPAPTMRMTRVRLFMQRPLKSMASSRQHHLQENRDRAMNKRKGVWPLLHHVRPFLPKEEFLFPASLSFGKIPILAASFA